MIRTTSRLSTLLLALLSLSVSARSQHPGPGEKIPWLFLEGRVSKIFTDIRSGSEYTTADNQSSQSLRVTARKYLTPRLSVGSGLGVGSRSFRLTSTYDRYIREHLPPGTPGGEINWINRLEYGDLHVELPMEARAEVVRIGAGAFYLRTGATWLVPLYSRNENYRITDNDPQPDRMPEAKLKAPLTALLNTGIGFFAKEGAGYQWYLELTYDWTTSDAVRPLPPDQQDPRSRHSPTLRARQLGLLFGVNL